MMWSLYNQRGDFLEPLKFSNSKTQESIVSQVLEAIDKGHRVIFIKGNPGTGKSAIALNIAKEFDRASIVVPVKYLQKQYEEDYMNRLYLLKDGKKLRISMITGRNNHQCLYQDGNADNMFLPCCIPIRKDNFELIKEQIEKNKNVDVNDFQSIEDVSRVAVGCACPYWSPIIKKEH
ncbi:DEAD/DEAH box helicase family protein, partial [Candidatus Woesearchaeota archaeon]|nr:DEAD/DEAH box helicase family protein [Candidatus Woesearchaeota archaeon]